MSATEKAEIEKIILSLDSKKSNDIYGVLVDLLKFWPDMSPVFSKTFTETLSNGVLTNHMKLAMRTSV